MVGMGRWGGGDEAVVMWQGCGGKLRESFGERSATVSFVGERRQLSLRPRQLSLQNVHNWSAHLENRRLGLDAIRQRIGRGRVRRAHSVEQASLQRGRGQCEGWSQGGVPERGSGPGSGRASGEGQGQRLRAGLGLGSGEGALFVRWGSGVLDVCPRRSAVCPASRALLQAPARAPYFAAARGPPDGQASPRPAPRAAGSTRQPSRGAGRR